MDSEMSSPAEHFAELLAAVVEIKTDGHVKTSSDDIDFKKEVALGNVEAAIYAAFGVFMEDKKK